MNDATSKTTEAKTRPVQPIVGRHWFNGSCAPGMPGAFVCSVQETFSVGIFEWVARSNGNGTKRGPVKVRVKGPFSQPDRVYAKAAEIVDALDSGTYIGPKTVIV